MTCSHHSHSGQFCAHAKNSLEEMVLAAISRGFHTFAMTEHIPREDQDLYPEEVAANVTGKDLKTQFEQYYLEARRLQKAYADRIHLLVGFETEWIRAPASQTNALDLLERHQFDIFIGSIHHVGGTPIDFDQPKFQTALAEAGGKPDVLFGRYFDEQLEMLEAFKPPVVGHFDLIRLLHENPNLSFRYAMPSVWQKIQRNLAFVVQYGGLLEVNSAALRKGLLEAYPNREICQEFLRLGGKFTLSDDSHAVDHVGTNYGLALQQISSYGIDKIWVFGKRDVEASFDARFPGVSILPVSVQEMEKEWREKNPS